MQTGLVLRRMIAKRDNRLSLAIRNGPDDKPSIDRIAATALGRAAERLHHLPVFIERVDLAPCSASELKELLPERALLTVLEGKHDDLGVMALCPSFLASIIEMQAIGRVTSRPVTGRRPTRTDSMIAADFVNALLAELAREVPSGSGGPSFASYRYATYIDDPRPLVLMLEDGQMQRLSLNFRVGPGGQRDASILIALPATESCQKVPTFMKNDNVPARIGLAAPSAPSPASVSLRQAVHEAPIDVVGILCRRKLSLHELRGLGPGSTIPLSQNVLDEARIETRQRQFLAQGRLGESDGFHAIRLKSAAASANCKPGEPKLMTPQPAPDKTSAKQAATETDPAEWNDTTGHHEPPIADLRDPDPFQDSSISAEEYPQGEMAG